NYSERSGCAAAGGPSSLRRDASNDGYCHCWQISKERRLREIAETDAPVSHLGGLLWLPVSCLRRGGYHARSHYESVGHPSIDTYHPWGKGCHYDMVGDGGLKRQFLCRDKQHAAPSSVRNLEFLEPD